MNVSAVPVRDPHFVRGVVLVLLAGFCWSLGGVAIRHIEAASVWQINLYRSSTLALTLTLVLVLRHRGAVIHAFRAIGLTGVVAGFFIAASNICFIYALTHTTVANTVFILAAQPFFAAALGWLVLREAVRRATWIAMVAGFAGVAAMVGEGIGTGRLAGNLIALGAALGFAAFTVALRRGREVDMAPAVCLGGMFVALAAALMVEQIAITPRDLGLCVFMGTIQIGLGLLLFTLGSRFLPAAELAILALVEVILAPLWVWIVVGEVPSLMTFFGGAVVLSAVVTNALTGMRRKRPPVGMV
ncbi:MAG: DMT family transporter [Alphaproteobacteria bacterium]